MAPGIAAGGRILSAARLRQGLALALCLGLLTGCAGALRWTPDYHVVREGETLFAIASRYDLDPRDLAAWNRLGDGRLIYPGQRLGLRGPAGAGTAGARTAAGASGTGKAAPTVTRPPPPPVKGWTWPTDGNVVAAFHATPMTESGIQISGKRGQRVSAAAGGEVVYAGSGLKSYGQLVIIKHSDSYLSAYGHNDALLVREGERVVAGQQIARMGEGPGQKPLLHFEIRRDGQPVNPLDFLPRR